jgi:subtilisin family serine protease
MQSLSVNASTIAVVDSGNDFKHLELAAKAWVNPLEIPDNDRDEDRNGYQDDINGWNFAEGTNLLIDYSYSRTDTADARKFFDIQLKSFLGTVTQDERIWTKEKFKDEEFMKNLELFAKWMHGTHVSGIAVKNSPEAKALGIKLMPTEVKLPGQKSLAEIANKSAGAKEFLLKAALKALAQQQSGIFIDIGRYMNVQKVDVMNGSFGTSFEAISGVIKLLYKTFFKKEPTAEELKMYGEHFFAVSLEETKKFLSASPHTLFVFAAGNDGTDNDVLPNSPTNVDAENKISVAATLGDQGLANFSCYGVKNVEVAAPGVGIVSTVPMDKHLAVSGTSQAAPYVANIAGSIKDANPKLGFREIKKIIMETVDVKSWLVGKVQTSGLVNRDRAIRAAELSKTINLSQAIAQSKLDILAKTANEMAAAPRYFQVPRDMILPLQSPFVIK